MSSLAIEHIDRIPVARPKSDIDAANAAAVGDELGACFEHGADSVVLDLSETRYIDSAGIDMLFRLGARLLERRASLLLVIPASSQLSRLAAIVGLDRAIPTYQTVSEALASWATVAAPGPVTGESP